MRNFLLATAALALTTPVFAMAEPASKDATPRTDQNESGDPNRIICKRDKAIGSRLSSKKMCATAAQWDQMRADNRQAVERAQANRPKSGQ